MNTAVGGLSLADIWETVADRRPTADALIHVGAHETIVRDWATVEDRAARLAAAFVAAGLGPGSKVGMYLHNGPEYLESTFAAFKISAVPVNINYRYRAEELAYLLENSDAEAVVVSSDLLATVQGVAADASKLRLVLVVDNAVRDGSVSEGAAASGTPAEATDGTSYSLFDFESVIADTAPARRRSDRSGDDLWFLYTGGTTGMPKGVMWPQQSLLTSWESGFARAKISLPATISEVVVALDAFEQQDMIQRLCPAAPLMHGTSAMTSMNAWTTGGCIVTLGNRSFDAQMLLRAVDDHDVTHLTIVGDAFAKPMLAALRAADAAASPFDLGSLALIYSSGTMWSQSTKDALLDHADLVLADLLGSSEGVGMAASVTSRRRRSKSGTGSFRLGEHAQVFTEDGRPVVPGSGEVGVLAVGGPIPVGYYKDPVKTAATFRTVMDRRWSIPGDHATVEADGTIRLLGRGSVCINTGGEKVFPEEVEEALKTHPGVHDANVVGVADEKWGQAVVAVFSPSDPASIPDAEALRTHVGAHLAGYKVPKRLICVDAVQRGPNGKADYRWARSVAEADAATEGH